MTTLNTSSRSSPYQAVTAHISSRLYPVALSYPANTLILHLQARVERIAQAIAEASLSFLGLGTQPPTPSWGWDLKAGLMILEINPWICLFPGIAIFLTVLAFNLFGDGLRDALDPRLKM